MAAGWLDTYRGKRSMSIVYYLYRASWTMTCDTFNVAKKINATTRQYIEASETSKNTKMVYPRIKNGVPKPFDQRLCLATVSLGT